MQGSEYLSAITGNSEVIPSPKSASLERVVHNAHRIELRGESIRKRSPTDPDVVSRRLICPLLERDSGMMVTSVDDSGDSFARALELLMSYPRSPVVTFC